MKRAIAYIYLKRYGEREELIELLTLETVESLALQGYITQGTTEKDENSYSRTWKKTNMTDEYFNLYIKPINEANAENGRYLHALGF